MGNLVFEDQSTQTPKRSKTKEQATQTPNEVTGQCSQTEGIDILAVVKRNIT